MSHDSAGAPEQDDVECAPGPVGRLLIPSSLLEHTLQGLQAYTPSEGLCYWYGRELASGAAIAMIAAFPRIYSTRRSFQLAEGQMSRLNSWSARHGLWLLSQVHTHPTDEPHSEADEAWAPTWRVGFLSVLLPFSAQLSTTRQPHWRVYECDSQGRWNEIAATRLEVFDDIWLPEG